MERLWEDYVAASVRVIRAEPGLPRCGADDGERGALAFLFNLSDHPGPGIDLVRINVFH